METSGSLTQLIPAKPPQLAWNWTLVPNRLAAILFADRPMGVWWSKGRSLNPLAEPLPDQQLEQPPQREPPPQPDQRRALLEIQRLRPARPLQPDQPQGPPAIRPPRLARRLRQAQRREDPFPRRRASAQLTSN